MHFEIAFLLLFNYLDSLPKLYEFIVPGSYLILCYVCKGCPHPHSENPRLQTKMAVNEPFGTEFGNENHQKLFSRHFEDSKIRWLKIYSFCVC